MTPSVELLLLLGPPLLFAMAAAETSLPIGLLVPAGVALALGAFLAHEGILGWNGVMVAAVAGALVGDSAGFWVGRSGSRAMGGGTGSPPASSAGTGRSPAGSTAAAPSSRSRLPGRSPSSAP